MRPLRPYRPAVAVLLAAVVLALVASPSSAATPPPAYVALGDSYAAGVGARPYPGDEECRRSPRGYPALVAQRYGAQLTLAACAGAVTADVLQRQATTVTASTTHVTLTVGGNDLGFSSVLTTCALPGWLGRCGPAVDRGLVTLRTALPGRLDRVLSAIGSRSPRARVVVTGYPRLFAGTDCSVLTFFTAAEMGRLNAATDELNATLRARAGAAGVHYVDPAPDFVGHAWCDDDPWVTGPTLVRSDAYHPNTSGYVAYASLVGPALLPGGSAGLGSGTNTSARTDLTTAASSRPARLPAGTASAGGHLFRVPDLNTAAVARAAARAGVTRSELERLRRAQRSGAANATLERLDAELTRRAAARRTDR